MEKKLLIIFGFLTAIAAGVLTVHPKIQNVKADSDNPYVKICHGNTDVNSAYITETPNIQNDGSLSGGHQNHTGPIASSLSVAQALKTAHTQWGDIIPPYNFYTCPNGYQLNGTVCTKKSQPNVNATSGSYTGLNWTTDGQAIWNNNCAFVTTPSVTPSTTPSVTPSVSPTVTVTPTPTMTVTPTPTTDPCANNACVTPTDPTATPTPTPTGTVTVTDTPTPTPTTTTTNGGGGGDGRSDGLSSCPSCTEAPQGHIQAVLGASTMASTGTFEENTMNLLAAMGIILMSVSAGYAKIFKKKLSY